MFELEFDYFIYIKLESSESVVVVVGAKVTVVPFSVNLIPVA
jgi:hypothetical protein